MPDYHAAIAANLGPRGDFPACFAFSMHKSGSTLLVGMISALCRKASLPFANIPHVLFHKNLPFSAWNNDRRLLEFFTDGRIYLGFRALPSFFEPSTILQERQCIFLVRDPRDALVSMYFSLGGRHISHKLPEKNPEAFLAHYKKYTELEIDPYVIHAAAGYRRRLSNYLDALPAERTLVRRYEEIYFDKKSLLADIFEHFSIDIAPGLIEEVAREFDIRPEKEQAGKHLRKGTPGDHRQKLKPETIEYLNDFFGEICSRLGYDLGSSRAC